MRIPIISQPVIRRGLGRNQRVSLVVPAVALSQDMTGGMGGDDDDFSMFAALEVGTEISLELDDDLGAGLETGAM